MSVRTLVFDTETTGLPQKGLPDHDIDQPKIVQLGAALYDGRKEIASIDLLIKPDGYRLSPELTAIHGITNEMLDAGGVHADNAFNIFECLLDSADRIAGHNVQFDLQLIKLTKAYFSIYYESYTQPIVCTADRSVSILRIPATAKMRAVGFNTFKRPKLSEAYEFFMKRPLIGAHSAMVDVRACADVLWAIEDWKELTP